MTSYQFFAMDNGDWRLNVTTDGEIIDIHQGPPRVIATTIIRLMLGESFFIRKLTQRKNRK